MIVNPCLIHCIGVQGPAYAASTFNDVVAVRKAAVSVLTSLALSV